MTTPAGSAEAADAGPWVTRQSLYGPAWLAVMLPSLPPALLWLAAGDLARAFATPDGALRSLGLLAGLCGYASFATNLVLGARIPAVERLFRSLDRVYRFHRRLGAVVGGLLVAHLALMVGAHVLPGGGIGALLSDADVAAGAVAFAGLAGLLAISAFARMRHETFQRVHRGFGLVYAVAGVHVLAVPGLSAGIPALRAYLWAVTAAGVGAWLYRSVLASRLVRRHPYRVARITPLHHDVNEVALVPVEDALAFAPGQFVFISVDDAAVTPEFHPFSITSSPEETELRLVVKALGDFTIGLRAVAPGAPVVIEGPYGGFWHEGEAIRRQIWIAGGIGVTPFLAMTRSLDLSDHAVDFYYCTEEPDAAVFLDELSALAELHDTLRVVPVPFTSMGFLTAEMIQQSSGDLTGAHMFLCGPPPMVDALTGQLVRLGVPRDHLHYEDFRLRGR